MSNRFSTPNPQFSDATGLPYANGSLYFYASGTSTPLNTYSDRALTVANTNPIVLDSAGRAGTVFLQNLAYKVVLQDANNNPIWTADPVYSSDFSAVAQFQSISGSPNGVLAGTAGSAIIPASSCWDYTNNILYVCTQTGTSSTAVWTAVNAATAAAVVPAPQGYLTPVSGTPVITSDSSAAATVYYTPYVGNIIPIYSGSSFVPTTFTEISCALVSAHTANTLYDFFVFNNSGVLTLVTGPAWASSAIGSSSRGTGASTTQLTKLNGIWVNAVAILARNGSTTYNVSANQATYVGTLWVDGSNGVVSCHRSYGQLRKWGIWNAYNRVPTYLKCGDSTANWSYATNAWRQANASSNNSAFVLAGLAEEEFRISLIGKASTSLSASASISAACGIGINSTTSPSGFLGQFQAGNVNNAGSNITAMGSLPCMYSLAPALGINQIYALENGGGSSACAFFGTESNMLLTVEWRV